MVELSFVHFMDDVHRDEFYKLNLEYLTWVDNESYTRYGVNVNPDGTVKEYLDSVFQKFTEIKPPNGIIYILEDMGKPVGMGALRKIEDEIGEIKRMYIRPNPRYRGMGYGKELLRRLEDKAKDFGMSILRLDTAKFTGAALHIYRKTGFKEVEKYSGGEWEDRSDGLDFMIYMEKHL